MGQPASPPAPLEHSSKHTADSYRWVVLAAATGAQTTAALLTQGLPPVAPFIQADYSLSRAQLGLLSMAVGSGGYFTLMLVGRLIDKLGERWIMLASGVIAGTFAVALIGSHDFWSTLLVLAFMGVGGLMSTPAGSKAVMSWFDLRIRGLAMGIRQVGIPLGGMAASLMLPPLALATGWRGASAVAGVLAIGGGVACFVLYREPPRKDVGFVSSLPAVSFRSILTDKDLWLVSIYALVMLGGQLTFSLYLVVFAHERLGLSEVGSGGLLALAQAAAVAGRIWWGSLSDRAFTGRRKPVLVIVAMMAAVLLVGFSLLGSGAPLWLTILLTLGLGASVVGWNGLYITSISEMAGQHAAGTALGVSLTISQMGTLAIPPLFGYLVDRTGSYQLGWFTLAMFLLVGTLPIFRARRAR